MYQSIAHLVENHFLYEVCPSGATASVFDFGSKG